MPGASIGYAVLPIVPSIRGVGAEISSQLSAPLSSAGATAGRSLGSSIASAAGTGLKVITAGIVGIGATVAGVALKGGFSRALNIQDAQASLKGLGHDTESITAIMGSALGAVRGTAFGLDQAAGVAAGAVAAGIKPGEALQRTLTLTADAATIAKTSMGEMGSIFNKVATSGKLTTEVVNQLQDRGIPVLQLVAEQYGVTAEAASEMVTKGEVDFDHFQTAMEAGLGGAALASGDTARGAFANVTAALSRVGAQFASPLIAGAPPLFQAIAGAIDRAGETLKPFAAEFEARLNPALAATTAWVSGLDFAAMIGGVQGIYDLIVGGDFTGKLSTAFGWQEDSGVVDFLLTARTAVLDFFTAVSSGDPAGSFSSIGSSITTLMPAITEFGAQLPLIGGAVGKLVASGLTVLTTVLSFLAENVDVIIQWMPAIVAGFLLWRVATVGVTAANMALRTAELAAIPAQITRNGLRLAAATLEWQAARATAASTATEVAATGAKNAGIGANIRAVASATAARVAMVASAAATGIVTAAQWLWNAALSANPIGLVILAIVALVAAIVWVATQTTFFQDAWTALTTGIGIAWTWLWETVLSPVFGFIGAIFTWLYQTIILPVVTGIMIYIGIWAAIFTWLWEAVISPVINFIGAVISWLWNAVISVIVLLIVAYVTMWANIFTWLYENIIAPVIAGIGTVINWIYSNVIAPVVGYIVTSVNMWGAIFSWLWNNAINPAIQAIGAAFNWVWNSIINPVVNFIQTGVRMAGDAVRAAFGGIADFMGAAFQGALAAVRGPVNGIISLVNGAIRGINSISVEIPAWVPLVGGQTFGVSIPTIPMLARGANISPRAGGTMAILGEGGRAETVTDLGKTNAALDATRQLAERAGGSDESVNFNGDVVTADPDELARKIQERRRRARLAKGARR